MKKISIISGCAILVASLSVAEPIYQATQTPVKTEKKADAANDKTAKKTETKKEVKKVPVRKTVTKKDNTKPAK